MAVVLDTHAAIWYLSRSEQLSAAALKKIEASVQAGESVFLSAISLVELIYLSEKGRLPAGALATLVNALQAADASMVVVPLDSGRGTNFSIRCAGHARSHHCRYRSALGFAFDYARPADSSGWD
jgi:hypothetical protein